VGELEYVNSFRDLLVYKKSRALSKEIFTVTRRFPKEEIYALTDQICRSSRSVGAQIAEAWAKRRFERHFISKLTDADGEQMETQHWLETARDCGYLSPEQASILIERYAEVGRMIGSMIAKAEKFCNPGALSVHDEQFSYIIDTENIDTEN